MFCNLAFDPAVQKVDVLMTIGIGKLVSTVFEGSIIGLKKVLKFCLCQKISQDIKVILKTG